MSAIKQQLHQLCLSKIDHQIKTLQEAIDSARASANEETKSSAGDKYETGRAMMQLEIEKNLTQLQEAVKVKNALQRIKTDGLSTIAQTGSLLITSEGNFYISISAGAFTIKQKVYQTLSPSSPLGSKLIGLKVGDTLLFQSKKFFVEKIE
jgi:transcription elongation GreA/GreB family factor